MTKRSKPQEPRRQVSETAADLGPRVRSYRQNRGMTQDHLALEANLDQSGLSKFERGTHSLSSSALERIAKVLDVDYDELVNSGATDPS